MLLLVGYSRHDYGDYGAGSQGNGCYKAHRGDNLTSRQGVETSRKGAGLRLMQTLRIVKHLKLFFFKLKEKNKITFRTY